MTHRILIELTADDPDCLTSQGLVKALQGFRRYGVEPTAVGALKGKLGVAIEQFLRGALGAKALSSRQEAAAPAEGPTFSPAGPAVDRCDRIEFDIPSPSRLDPEHCAACLHRAEELLRESTRWLFALIEHTDFAEQREAIELSQAIQEYQRRRDGTRSILEQAFDAAQEARNQNMNLRNRLEEIERTLAFIKVSEETRANFIAKYSETVFNACLQAFHNHTLKDKKFDYRKFEHINHAFLNFSKKWLERNCKERL